VDNASTGLAYGQAGSVTNAARRAELISQVAEDQCGLLTGAQLQAAGVTPAAIRGHLDARRWQRHSRAVIALQSGPLTSEQSVWFAVLDGGEDCALAGLSALHRFGLQGFPVERVQVAVPPAGRSARHNDYVRRRSRRLTPDAIHPARRPPTMRVPIALLDALEQTTLPLRGCALLAATVQQRLIRAESLPPLISAEKTLPHRKLYMAVAGDIEGGAHSLLEIDFRRLAQQAGLPPPRQQVVRTDRSGRRRYLDAEFDTFVVEVDGAIHLRPLAWWDDMFRQNSIVITGRPVLRFASVGIRLFPDKVVEQLREAGSRWPIR
jgi:hypothetical protein